MRLKAPGKPAIALRGTDSGRRPAGVFVTTETGSKRPMSINTQSDAAPEFLGRACPSCGGGLCASAGPVSPAAGGGRQPHRGRGQPARRCRDGARLPAHPAGRNFSAAGRRRIAQGAVRDRPLRRRADQSARRRRSSSRWSRTRSSTRSPSRGTRSYKDDQLAGVVQSQPRGVFTRAKVQSDVAAHPRALPPLGRFRRPSRRKIIELPDNRVNLVFEITEGPKTGVSGITFIGNQAFGDARLRNVIETRRSGIFELPAGGRHLRSGPARRPTRRSCGATTSTAAMPTSRSSPRSPTSTASATRSSSPSRSTRAALPLRADLRRFHHPRRRSGGARAPGDRPTRAMSSPAPRSRNRWRRSRCTSPARAIRSRRCARGSTAIPTALTIGVTYIVDEGARVYVERIEVRGNTRTRDYVDPPRVRHRRGRCLQPRADRPRRAAAEATSATSATCASPPSRAPRTTASSWWSTSSSSRPASSPSAPATRPRDGIVGDISLTERNFLGRGYNLRVAVGGGDEHAHLRVRLHRSLFPRPAHLGRRQRLPPRHTRRTTSAPTTTRRPAAASPSASRSPRISRVQIGYQLELQEIDVDDRRLRLRRCATPDGIDGDNVSRAICQAEGDTLVSSVLYSLIYDTLDSRLDPRDGIYAKFTQEFAGVGGDVSFLRTTGTRRLLSRAAAGSRTRRLRQGAGRPYLRASARTCGCSTPSSRAARRCAASRAPASARATSHTDDALGGNIYAAATAEVQFPLPVLPRELGFKGAFFADAGTLFDTRCRRRSDFGPTSAIRSTTTRRSAPRSAARILWASPLGPLRADFAYVLTKEDYDETQFFRIGGGTRF